MGRAPSSTSTIRTRRSARSIAAGATRSEISRGSPGGISHGSARHSCRCWPTTLTRPCGSTERLELFSTHFTAAHARVLRAKIGLAREEDDDPALAADLLARMASNRVDYTVLFRRLCTAIDDPAEDARIASLFAEPGAFHGWSHAWRHRLAREGLAPDLRVAAMRLANPAFVPRNHRVEQAIEAAVRRDDFEPFETLVQVLGRSCEEQPEFAHLADPPRAEERVLETFCGT